MPDLCQNLNISLQCEILRVTLDDQESSERGKLVEENLKMARKEDEGEDKCNVRAAAK